MPFKYYTYTPLLSTVVAHTPLLSTVVAHIPLLSTVVAHTLLNTAHTVSSDCGYNPGWCCSHPTVSEMT